MKRWLLPFAVLAILGLAACPPEGNDDDDDDTDASVADASGCNRPNGGARSVPCTTDDDCRCGLSCLKMQGMTQGICMERCVGDTDCEAPTPVCGVGSIVDIHQQYEVPTFNENMCVGTIGQYSDCFNALSRCEESLECYPSVGDDNDENEIPDYWHCQEICALGDSSSACSDGNQTCVPNNAGLYEIQVDDPQNPTQRVACTDTDCPGTSCPCATGFGCIEFTIGSYCGRLQGMCGSAAQIIPSQTLAGGSIPGEYICDSSQGIGCDMTLGGIDDPAQVMCLTDIFASDPAIGICISICGEPDDAGVYTYTNCPTGMECLTDPAFFYAIIQENGANKTCTTDDSCAAYPGATCGEFTSGNFCARPYGMCGNPVVQEDAGVTTDATVVTDALSEDLAVVVDAGTSEDAAVAVDAAAADTATPDTFTPDTFTPDTFTPDTFTPDTFTPDTAVDEDAASEDAASEDI